MGFLADFFSLSAAEAGALDFAGGLGAGRGCEALARAGASLSGSSMGSSGLS
jgi:hypothetical protein